MRSPRRPDPPPLRTNDRLVAAVGTVAWAVALVVLLIIGLPEDARWWLWVCVCGIATGLFGYWYLPRLHRARAAQIRRATPAASQEDLPGPRPDADTVPERSATGTSRAAEKHPPRG